MSIVEIDEGYDFRVLVVDDAWVLRFPRWPGAVEALEKEIALLPALSHAVPVAVPRFEHVSREPLFAAYRFIQGKPLVDEDPEGVRAFLDALHSSGLTLESKDWVESYRAQCVEFAGAVLPLLDVDLRARAEALFAEVDTLVGFEPVLVHADLGPPHLLVHEGRLAGVIDWGDAQMGDPALDYSWLLNVPFPSWDVDPDLRRRARFYHRLAPWYEAHYGLTTERPAHVESGVAAIRARLGFAG